MDDSSRCLRVVAASINIELSTMNQLKQFQSCNVLIITSISNPMTINQAYLDGEDNLQATTNGKPNAWRIQGDKNIEEKTLERNLYGNSRDNMNPVKEGQAMGRHSFGKSNTSFAGNDKNNPSQYAGNTNPYFDRTEPMEEHPEHNNFKSSQQQGEPDYNKA